jgi:hypothetical protein
MEKGTGVALAGIAAGAIVGLGGAAASLLIARDDRANQRSLAHDNRVYDRRADTYLAALAVIQEQRFQINKDWLSYLHKGAKIRDEATKFRMAGDVDANLRARLIAFGSPRIVATYGRLHSIADDLHKDELFAADKTFRRADEDGEQRRRSLYLKLGRGLTTFDKREKQFEQLVQLELS